MRKALAYLVMSVLALVFFAGAIFAFVAGVQAIQALLASAYLATWTMVLCVATTVIFALAATVLLMAVSVAIVKVMYQDAGYTGSVEQCILLSTFQDTVCWPSNGLRAFWQISYHDNGVVVGYAEGIILCAYPRALVDDEVTLRKETGEKELCWFPRLLNTGQLSDALRGGEAVRYTLSGKRMVLRTY